MSDIPPGITSQILATSTLRSLAQQYNVPIYRIRAWRAQLGLGAPTGRIKWDHIATQQRDIIRDNFPRNQWRSIVDRILENNEHYETTGESLAQYGYYDWIDDYEEDFIGEDDWEETARVLGWYHGRRAQ